MKTFSNIVLKNVAIQINISKSSIKWNTIPTRHSTIPVYSYSLLLPCKGWGITVSQFGPSSLTSWFVAIAVASSCRYLLASCSLLLTVAIASYS